MPRCTGITRSGDRCTAIVEGSFCYQHDPARAEERSRNAARAARSRPNRELTDIKRRLSDLADAVLEGSVDKGVGAVVSQILGTYVRTVSVELRVREQLELIERLEALEEAHEAQKMRGPYGA